MKENFILLRCLFASHQGQGVENFQTCVKAHPHPSLRKKKKKSQDNWLQHKHVKHIQFLKNQKKEQLWHFSVHDRNIYEN